MATYGLLAVSMVAPIGIAKILENLAPESAKGVAESLESMKILVL